MKELKISYPIRRDEIESLVKQEALEQKTCSPSGKATCQARQKEQREKAIKNFTPKQQLDFQRVYSEFLDIQIKEFYADLRKKYPDMVFEEPKSYSEPFSYKIVTSKGFFPIIGIIFIVAISFLLYQCSKGNSELQIEKQRSIATEIDSQTAVKASLKDPDSAEFQNVHGACGEVNSKNGFGGMTGFKRYIGNSGIVAIEGENISTEEFNAVWDKFCLGDGIIHSADSKN